MCRASQCVPRGWLLLCGGGRGGRAAGGGPQLTPALSLQADLCVMTRLLGYVDPWEPCFVAAVLAIVFNPLFWNVVSTALPALGLGPWESVFPLPIEVASS